ncbi:hypothetical protein BD626DRAFT_447660 [Schizophyllum amplum]|uniref:Class E vacuolar protein-sorting machinery protein HSE1 n=1 Tax=Schizophyllum amplum TaxID=97359 RepID=A0A550CXU5_9AGAR|nr:hypothetical protein BD626DRAFT_447660 [Auriculariopsis ampla]
MFGGSGANPYDDVVNKATDENLTGENWEILLNLCDKVSEEGQEGARNALAALLKRLVHRNPNVQLYALSAAEALSKNCGIEVNREIASRAWTQGMEKVITDRNTHDKVRKRALGLIAQWTAEFQNDETLGIMEDCYHSLEAKNYKFETPSEPPPPAVDDEIRRREEEELQRVLEMSMQDRGGRNTWAEYGANGDTAGSSSSGGGYSGGYAPAAAPATAVVNAAHPATYSAPQSASSYTAASPAPYSAATPTYTPSTPSMISGASTTSPATPIPTGSTIVTRVRALYTFEPTEPGELAFEKGDIIKVVDRGYKDWWRGQSKGRTGIFPVNYVEPLPEPSAAELAREAEAEAAVFAQAVNVDRLLNMLKSLDPSRDNLADNEEIQELYHACMSLRPKIVKLIDKYSQKRADLVSMNETFVRARTIFDRMMEDSLQRNVYDPSTYRVPSAAPYGQRPDASYGPPRPDSRGTAQFAGYPQQAAYQQPGYPSPAPYEAYPPQTPGGSYAPPTPGAPYPAQATPAPYGAQQQAAPGPYGPQQQPAPYGYRQHQPVPQGYAAQPGGYPQQATYPGQLGGQSYPQQGEPQPPAPGHQQSPGTAPQQPSSGQIPQQHPSGPMPQQQQLQQPPVGHPEPVGSPVGAQSYENPMQSQPYGASPYPAMDQAVSPQPHLQPQAATSQQSLPQMQPSAQPQPEPQQQAAVQLQASTYQPAAQQPTAQEQQQQPITQGPPYVYDPHAKYADPNVQAWATYYSQGGRDPAGAVYFFSVPGVTEELPNPAGAPPPSGQAADNASSLHRVDSNSGASVISAGASTVRANSIGGASFMGDTPAVAVTHPTSSSPELANPHAQATASQAGVEAAGPAPAAGGLPAATPSWVLPKRAPGSGLMGATHGAPASPGGPEGGMHSMQGQFAAMNVGSGAA